MIIPLVEPNNQRSKKWSYSAINKDKPINTADIFRCLPVGVKTGITFHKTCKL